MTIEELNSVFEVKAKIESERAKLETLKICSESVKPIELSDLPKAKNQSSAVERFAVSIIESEQKILALQNELVEVAATLAQKLTFELSRKSPLLLSVMIRRYCACMTISEIARSLHFTRNYIQKLHKQAAIFLTNGEWRATRAKKVLGNDRKSGAAAATSA